MTRAGKSLRWKIPWTMNTVGKYLWQHEREQSRKKGKIHRIYMTRDEKSMTTRGEAHIYICIKTGKKERER